MGGGIGLPEFRSEWTRVEAILAGSDVLASVAFVIASAAT